MTDLGAPARPWWRLSGLRNRLVAAPDFQRWAAAFPLTRRIALREGEALFNLVAGFVHSQVLLALVELDLPRLLRDQPATPEALAPRVDLAPDRLAILLQAGAALGLLRRRRDGRFGLAQRGAALLGVPGLEAMIRHHHVFYRDLQDPVALLRGTGETGLAVFWPYVFGAATTVEPEVAATYSDLMAQSQGLVADDTLRAVSLQGVGHLMDVGGGTGAFLAAAATKWPALRMTLFDLPAVVPAASARFARAGIADRVTIVPGSFRSGPLPAGADAISLVRVLYDHADDTVRDLLARAHAALPPGGRLIISEPMSGGAVPERAGDVYFAFYTLAMRTGRARSAATIADLCRDAGFTAIETPRPARPFVTSVVTARKS